jgi:hypothetical protein
MNDKISTFFFAAACTALVFGILYITYTARPEITIIRGDALIKYKEFTYKVKEGETFLGVLNDSSLLARIRTYDGIIRFEKPQERQ